MAVSLSSYWRLVSSNRNYRRLWSAQIVSEMGDWIYCVALYSLLLELTGTAKSVALAFVLQVLPQFFVSPAAGVLNDRISRKRVMIATDLARALIVLAMLFVARAQVVWLIYALLFCETVMWAFFEPGRSAAVPNITSGEELVAANALSSMTWSLNLALGSGVGGAIAAFFGRDAVFILNALSFLFSAFLLRGMTFPEPHLERAAPLRPRDLVDFSPFLAGVRYMARDRRILALLLVKAGLGLLGTHWVLLPIFGERIFPVKTADAARGAMLGMSALMSARGIGSLLGPVVAGYWAGRERPKLRRGILLGFAIAGAGSLALAVSPSLGAAVLSAALSHGGVSIAWVFSTTLLQFQTDDRFRGRVFSADFAFMVLTMSLATYGSGVLIDWGVSVRWLAAATAALAVPPALAWLFLMRLWRDDQRASKT